MLLMTPSHESGGTGAHPNRVTVTMNHSSSSPDSGMFEGRMTDDKKLGVTHSIRERLHFLDERLWKRFLARRLELIDTLDLSLKKASEQEEEIKKVAEVLRLEFKYEPEYFPDFDKLVRAAVQSVRRNRKRSTKTRRSNVKRRRLSQDAAMADVQMKEEYADSSESERGHFISEISRLNTDGQQVYDMSYSRTKSFSSTDQSRAAIDSIIQPVNLESRGPHLGVLLPPIGGNIVLLQAENEKELQAIRLLLLLLMKRSKLCLKSATTPGSDYVRILGLSALASISAMVFEKSFSSLNSTSVEYLQEKVTLTAFLARFYRSLEPDSAATQTLDDDTASLTLQTLIGCCIKDFGFDKVLFLIGEALYRSILIEYPLVLKSASPFLRADMESLGLEQTFQTSLTNLATVASEIRSHMPSMSPTAEADETKKKLVVLRFLLSSLEFTYPIHSLAPPRLVELLENAKQAFKLNDNQIFALRNCRTGATVRSDFDLEKIFENEDNIELEIFLQRFQAIPIYDLASTVTSTKYNDDLPKIILPPPIKHATTPVLPTPISHSLSTGYSRTSLLPKFQPLL